MKPLIAILLAATFLLALPSCTTTTPKKVQRFGWVTGLRPEKASYYKDLHAHPTPAVNRMIKDCNIRNFSIYAREIGGKEYLFAYLEYTGKDFPSDMKKMAADPATVAWWKKTDPCQSPLPDARANGKIWSDMTEVYHLD